MGSEMCIRDRYILIATFHFRPNPNYRSVPRSICGRLLWSSMRAMEDAAHIRCAQCHGAKLAIQWPNDTTQRVWMSEPRLYADELYQSTGEKHGLFFDRSVTLKLSALASSNYLGLRLRICSSPVKTSITHSAICVGCSYRRVKQRKLQHVNVTPSTSSWLSLGQQWEKSGGKVYSTKSSP